MFKKMLDHFGYRIVVATSGAEASTAFALHRPDAIILDIYLPDLAEFDLCTAVRSRCGVPIILMTGGDIEMNTQALASLRSDYILNKPFGITELRDSIRACLLARRSESLL
jgi:DNA-binding response OmpR family regulator